jgi:hypothetical protein
MADNVAITAGSGTSIATDDIAGVQYQRTKLSLGADGTAVDAVAGAGVVGTGVQRITLASDDPAVALLGTIDTDTGAMVTDLAAIEVLLGTIDTDTGAIVGHVDGIETLLTTIDGRVDGIEGQLTTITGHVDGIEGSLTTLTGTVTSNRVAVNLITGQAGVAGGSGNTDATTLRVTLANDGQTAVNLNNALVGEYETVAASQTNQVLGPTGATGDYLAGVLIVPATTSPGNVIILDNATSITIFTGGASSVSNLVPFMVPLGMKSVSGSWRITTGSNVSAIGIGNFT